MNRLSTYLLPTTAALALVAGGYILWEHRKHAIGSRTTNPRSNGVVEAKFSKVAIPGEQAEETAAIKQEHEEVQAGEDRSLLQQYDWNAYTKAPPLVRALYEAMLLSSLLLNLGTTLNQEETSKLLMANAGLRKTLLECWETGRFDLLRRHDTIVALVQDVPHRRNRGADASPTAADTADKVSQLNAAPTIKNEKDDGRCGYDVARARTDNNTTVVTQVGSQSELDCVPSLLQLSRGHEERGRDAAEDAREGAIIQRGEESNKTVVKGPETTSLAPKSEAANTPSPTNVRGPQGTRDANSNTPERIEIYGGTFNDVAGDQIIQSSDHYRQVAEWYSPTDYRVTHHDISKKRANNTGVWLLESEVFKQWQTDPNCRILWCPGIRKGSSSTIAFFADPIRSHQAGVGKTTIASLVIDHLRQQCSETNAVGFAYFNYKLQSQQSTTMVLECLSRQLYEAYDGKAAMSGLETFYEANRSAHPRPPATGLHPTLSKACHQFQRYYIVLDAFDEYLEKYNIENLRELLSSLASLGPAIKLLVTSRVLGGMKELFKEFNAARQDIDVNDADMSTYISNRIWNARFQFDIPDELSQEIVEKVKEAAGGRFLMAELHMNTLAAQLNRGSLKRTLANLPHDIDVTYERVLQRFKTYQDSHRELAMMALTWVTRAKRRLSVEELQHALATEAGLENIDDYVTPISTITSLCAGLVIVRDESVIFVHFTAQDFFDNSRIQSEYFPTAEESILKTCLDYVSLPLCISTYRDPSSYWGSSYHDIPFYDYAARNLGTHAQRQAEGAVQDLDVFLSSNGRAVHQWCKYVQARGSVEDLASDPAISTVFLAIHCDRVTPLQNLLSTFKDVPLTPKGKTPLMYAAHEGRTACLEAMLSWSHTRPEVTSSALALDSQNPQDVLWIGHINDRDTEGYTALAHACRQGHKEAVALLLNHESIDINLADDNGRTPLSHAAESGHEGVVVLLLNHKGINVNMADTKGRTPLSHAANWGHEGVVGLLLNHKDINVNLAESDGWTPLIWAARKHEGVVELLLNHEGIDVNLADKEEWTPLIWAVAFNQEAVTKHLLRHPEIQLNRQDTKGATALARTIISWEGKLKSDVDAAKTVIQLLLSRDDLDINLPDNEGHTPLFYALRGAQRDQRWEGLCKLLRARGAVEPDWLDFLDDSLFPELFISFIPSSG